MKVAGVVACAIALVPLAPRLEPAAVAVLLRGAGLDPEVVRSLWNPGSE